MASALADPASPSYNGASQQDIKRIGKVKKISCYLLRFCKKRSFDKVDHGILLNKLKKIRINSKIRVWIHNFLSNSQQCVAVNGTSSEASSSHKWRTPRVSVRAPPIPNRRGRNSWYKLRNSGLNSIMLCQWYSNPSGNKRWRGHTDATKWFT